MCGPDHEPPTKNYTTHESIKTMLDGGEYVLEVFPVSFKTSDGKPYTFKSYIAYRKDSAPKPVVMVLPNYAGLKDFDKDQALFLAKLGYVGLAVDLYPEVEGYMYADRNPVVVDADSVAIAKGDGREYVNMQDAKLMEYWMAMAQPDFDPEKTPITPGQAKGMGHFKNAFIQYQGCLRQKGHWRNLMELNLKLAKEHPSVHPDYAGAIGYCFGGQCILDMVRMGCDLQGVVSFHGLLQSEPQNMLKDADFDGKVNMEGVVDNYNSKCMVLIENAEFDDHVSAESIVKFQAEMNEHGVDWQIHHHSGIKHGWALPPGVWATEYDEKSDRRSTNNMIALFREVFPEHPPHPVAFNAAGASLNVMVDASLLTDPDSAQPTQPPAFSTVTTTVTAASADGVTKTVTTTEASPQ